MFEAPPNGEVKKEGTIKRLGEKLIRERSVQRGGYKTPW